MYLRAENGWELWSNVHPTLLECEDGSPCVCKYHVVASDRSVMHSFDNYHDADMKFRELSGGIAYEIGKTSWQRGEVQKL